MLIILEGPDGAGKSTVAGALIKALGPETELLHRGPPTAHLLDEYEAPLFSYSPGSGRNIICDRWHIGEWVYPEVMGRASQADGALWAHIELFLKAKGAIVVFMDATVLTLKERLAERGETFIDSSHLAPLRRAYAAIKGKSILPAVDTSPSIQRIISTGRFAEAEAASLVHNGSYVGSRWPRILLFGERTRYEAPYPPAFGPYPSTSGHYLLSWYSKLRPIHRLGITNVYEEDPVSIWTTTDHPNTVALGQVAHKQLSLAGVPHGAVPHPQYIRRFHHSRGQSYVNAIERAAYGQEDLSSWRP